ncbi:hypothetical protein CO726_25065 [Bacillus fungorum]|uniref:Uncharacterized protein n=1 Tax=Bacillus fungorum TaxID=2039284 RepID=A0A2G6Q8K2_9BACI|nr:hypothetical protein [Bacillus fungorum]PIE92720.1 hypothetical protein CO726_25065 [Bacillus fungorum]
MTGIEMNKSIEEYLNVLTGSTFIKIAEVHGNQVVLETYSSYDEYKINNSDSLITENSYEIYYSTGDAIEKILAGEPVRILRSYPQINEVLYTIRFREVSYTINITRDALDEFLGFNIIDLNGSKELWRNRYVNVYLSGLKNKKRKGLVRAFSK